MLDPQTALTFFMLVNFLRLKSTLFMGGDFMDDEFAPRG